MNPATEDILRAALALPEDERTELVDALLAEQAHSGDLPFDPSWLTEIRRRSAELDAGNVQPTPWPEVRERVRRRVEGRSSG
jgi:putative addiction module component (TIGR02574 family)